MRFRSMTEEDLSIILRFAVMEFGEFIREEIEDLYNKNTSFVSCDDEVIYGGAFYEKKESVKDENVFNIGLFVKPEYRRKKLATKMMEELAFRLKPFAPEELILDNFINYCDITGFMKKQNFVFWYSNSLLEYENSNLYVEEIICKTYSDEFYTQMSNLRSEAFEEVRIKNKMKPFYIEASEEERKLMKDEKELYHLLFEGAFLIGAVKVKGNSIDLLMTHKDYRGKGYGKKLLQYGINLIIKEGHSTSNLYIIDTNQGARKLYESVGFKNKETVKIYKKVLLG